MQALGVATWRANFEEELSAFLHDLLDLQEAGCVHDHELLAGRHGKLTCVAEGQNLLEAGRRHRARQLECTLAITTEEVSEIEAAGGQDGTVDLEGLAFDHDEHITVEA